MKVKLLRQIRKRYAISVNKNEYDFRYYSGFNRLVRSQITHSYFIFWINKIIDDLFGSFIAARLVEKHQRNKEKRRIKSDALMLGYTEKQLLWLKKE